MERWGSWLEVPNCDSITGPVIRKNVLPLGALLLCGAMFGQAPTITSNGVVNVATFDNRLCPGGVAAVFGTNFGNSKTGVTVTVSGKPGFLINVSPTQLAFQIPFEVLPGPATVAVMTPARALFLT
jgi:hypothetical protein